MPEVNVLMLVLALVLILMPRRIIPPVGDDGAIPEEYWEEN